MSDKKNLLNESQIRQFMKLASLTPLSSGFVKGLTERTAEEIEESHGRGPKEGAAGYGSPDQNSRNEGLEDDLDATEDELGGEDEVADEEGAEIDDLEADLDAEVPVDDDGRMISVDDFLGALESALETVLGDEVEIDSDEMEADEDEVEVADVDVADDGMDMDVEVEDEEMLDEDVSKGSDAEEDESLGMEDGKEADKDMSEKGRRKVARADARKDESTVATDDLVEAITKRVAARILKSALAKK